MNRSLLIGILSAGFAACATAVVFLVSPPAAGDAGTSHETVDSLQNEVRDLRRSLDDLRKQVTMIPATAAAPRELAPATIDATPTPGPTASPALANVGSLDRETVFALIKEERDLRDKEREERQRTQAKEAVSRRIQQSAERAGIDSATTSTLVNAYLRTLEREEEIRRAYPLEDWDDPSREKRQLEIEAARKDRDALVASLVPADKLESWNRSTRFLGRAGDFAGMVERFGGGDFGGAMMGGGGRNRGESGGSGPGNGPGRRNRDSGPGGNDR